MLKESRQFFINLVKPKVKGLCSPFKTEGYHKFKPQTQGQLSLYCLAVLSVTTCSIKNKASKCKNSAPLNSLQILVFFTLFLHVKYCKVLSFWKVFLCHPRYFSEQLRSVILTWWNHCFRITHVKGSHVANSESIARMDIWKAYWSLKGNLKALWNSMLQSHLGYTLPCASGCHICKQMYQKENACSDAGGVNTSIQVGICNLLHLQDRQRKQGRCHSDANALWHPENC